MGQSLRSALGMGSVRQDLCDQAPGSSAAQDAYRRVSGPTLSAVAAPDGRGGGRHLSVSGGGVVAPRVRRAFSHTLSNSSAEIAPARGASSHPVSLPSATRPYRCSYRLIVAMSALLKPKNLLQGGGSHRGAVIASQVHLPQNPPLLITLEVLPQVQGLVICADPHHHGATLAQATGLLQYGTRVAAKVSPRRRASACGGHQ